MSNHMVGKHEECMTEMKWESTGLYANAPQGEEALALLFTMFTIWYLPLSLKDLGQCLEHASTDQITVMAGH